MISLLLVASSSSLTLDPKPQKADSLNPHDFPAFLWPLPAFCQVLALARRQLGLAGTLVSWVLVKEFHEVIIIGFQGFRFRVLGF